MPTPEGYEPDSLKGHRIVSTSYGPPATVTLDDGRTFLIKDLVPHDDGSVEVVIAVPPRDPGLN